MKIFKFFFILLLSGCAHQEIVTVNIDLSLAIPFDEARVDVSTSKSPALYKFTKGNKQLWYLASKHSNDPNSDTFQFVKYVFNNQKIDIVIVEGFQTDLGLNPSLISKNVLEGKTATFYPNAEPSYTIENAINKKVIFVGGEPSDLDIHKAILAKGYQSQDLLAFNFVRRMPQLKRSAKVSNLKSLEGEFDSYIKSKKVDFGIEGINFSFQDFKKWYQKNQHKPLSIDAGDKGETAPIEGPYFTQSMSKIITTIRDEHILKTINELMNKYQNVLIVYGSSHYRVEHRALKSALGEPKEIDLSDVQ